MSQPQDKGVQFYNFVKEQGIEVPSTYEEFSSSIADPQVGSQFYDFVKEQGIAVPDTFNEFQSNFVKKKEATEVASSGGSSDVSPSLSRSRSGGKTLFGFSLEDAIKVYDTLPPAEQKIIDLKLRKIEAERKVESNLAITPPDPFTPPIDKVDGVEMPTDLQKQRMEATKIVVDGAIDEIDKNIASLEDYIAYDDISSKRGTLGIQSQYADARRKYKTLEKVAQDNGQDIIGYLSQNPQDRPILDAYEASRREFERSNLETYLDYYREKNGDGEWENLTRSVASLMPQIRDRAREGRSGYSGLLSYLEDNIEQIIPNVEDRAGIDVKMDELVDYSSTGNQLQLGELRKLSDLMMGVNSFYANYANQRYMELAGAVRSISEENNDAIDLIDKSVSDIERVTAKMLEIEENNPRLFSDRRKTAATLADESKALAKEMIEVEKLYKKVQSNPEDIALSEAYSLAAQSYNSKREAFNSRLRSMQASDGDGVVAEHRKLVADYERLVGDIEGAREKLGEDFFDMADELTSLGESYDTFMKDSADSVDMYAIWSKLSEGRDARRLEDAKTTTWGFIREGILAPFGDAVFNSATGALVEVPNVVATLVEGDERGASPLRGFYDTLQENKRLAAAQLPKVAATGFITRDEEGEVPWQLGWASATSQGMGSVFTFMTGGGLGVKLASKLAPKLAAKSATKWGSRVGITATGTAAMTNGLYQESLAVGLDARDAAAASLAMGLVLGYTETLVNDYTTYAPWEKAFKDNMFKSMATNFAKRGAFKPSLVTDAATMAWRGLGEAKEEALASLAEGVMKLGLNVAYGEDLYELPDATEIAEASITGFVTGGMTAGLGFVGSRIHPQYASEFLDIVDDEVRLQRVTTELGGSLTSEEFAKFQGLVNTYKGVLDGYDTEAMDDVDKLTIADAVVKIGQMEEQIKRDRAGDVLEAQLRPKINAEKAKIVAVLGMREAASPTNEAPEGRLASEVIEEQAEEAFIPEVEEANREFDTYTTEVAGDEVLTTEVSNALGAIERNESLEDTQADRAISAIFNEVERVENSNLSEANKERITSALYDIAEQIDNYDFRAKVGTVEVTEGITVTDTRRNVATQRAERYFAGQQATDGNGNTVELTTDGDRVVAKTEDGSEVVFDTPSMEATAINMDSDGNLGSVTMTDRFGTSLTFTGEVALDLAIRARTLEVGDFPPQTFNEIVRREEQRLIEYRKSEETTPTQPVVREQGDATQESVAEEARPTPQERGVDGAEEAATEATVEGDTATTRGVEELIANVDSAIERLDTFGRETLGINIPVALAKGVLKSVRAALVAGKSLAEAIDAGMAKLRSYKWYQNLSAENKADVEAKFADAINNGKPLPTKATTAQMKAVRALRDASEKLLKRGEATFALYERLGLGRFKQMSLGVLGKMRGDVIEAFTEEMTSLLAKYEATPTQSIEEDLQVLMDEFSESYLQTQLEANIQEGDSEGTKRRKFEEGVEEAAIEIEEAMAALPDFADLATEYKEVLNDGVRSQREINANIEVLRKYLADAMATLRGKTADELFAAFSEVYGFDFQTFGANSSSARILHELREAAAILQTLAAREKIPSNMQAIQTASELVNAYEKADGIASDYGKQKDIMALLLERLGGLISERGAEVLPLSYAKLFFGRTSRGGIIMNALKYFTTSINNVDRARVLANQTYARARTRVNESLLKVKFQATKKVPDNMSAKIARKYKRGTLSGIQLNSFTQDIMNVLSGMVMMQRMIDNNPEFYGRGRKGDIRKILDAWAKGKSADVKKNPYSTKGKKSTPLSIQERINDELYEGVYAWLNENGYFDADENLDWRRAIEDMGDAEREFMGLITQLLDETGATVSTHSNAARNEDLPMFSFYTPVNETDDSGANMMLESSRTHETEIERQLTTPTTTEFNFTERGDEDLGVNRPTTPSAAHPRTNKSFNRPLILSTTALIYPHLRQVYRDAYVTPEVQRAQRAIAFAAAMQQNADAKTQNASRADLRKVAAMITEVFTPRTMMETPEEKMHNRIAEKIVAQLTKVAMVSFLTTGVIVKMVSDTLSDGVINIARNGFLSLGRGYYANNHSKDAKRWEGFIDGAGFQLVDQLGSETSQLQSAGIMTGNVDFDAPRSYSKYSVIGQWLSAWNSVPVPAGRRNLLGAVKRMLGIDAAARKGVGAAVVIMATANFVNSPAAVVAAVRRNHKRITGRNFDINEWVDAEGKMRELTEEQRRILPEIVQRADRATAERAGESSPAAAPSITRKAGRNPWVVMILNTFMPFMNWPFNNTVETYRATTQVLTGRKFSDKENLLFGVSLGDSDLASRISGLNEVTARVSAAAIYTASRGYMLAMLGAALYKSIAPYLFGELQEPDDEEEELMERIREAHGNEVDKIFEALPNMTRKAILETYVEGLPVFNLIPWASVIGENNIASVKYDKEDLERNRYLRVTQGTPFKEDFSDEEQESIDILRRFLSSVDPEELGRKGGSAPIYDFLNSADYVIAYYAMDAEAKRIAENLDIPKGERYLLTNMVLGMLLKNPLISDFNRNERENVMLGRKRLKAFMKKLEGSGLEKQLEEVNRTLEGSVEQVD